MSGYFRFKFSRLQCVSLLALLQLTLLLQSATAQQGGSPREQGEALARQACAAHERGDYPSAAAFIKQACTLDPSTPALHIIYGGYLTHLGQYDQAIGEIRKAIDLGAPQNTWAMIGAVYVKKGDLKGGAEAFEHYLQSVPIGTEALLARTVVGIFKREGSQGAGMQAIQAHEQGGEQLSKADFAGAASSFKQSCDLEPSVAGFHCDYGFALFKLGRNDEAQSEFQKTIDLDKNVSEAWRNIGSLHKIKGESQIAVQDYEEYLRLAPNAPDAALISSLIAALRQNAPESQAPSVEGWTTFIVSHPEDAVAYSQRAKAYAIAGQNDRAIEDCTKAISLNSTLIEPYVTRAKLYCRSNQYQKALDECQRLLNMNPRLAEAYSIRGNAYHDLGQYRESIASCDQAIQLNPQLADAYNNRAASYLSSDSKQNQKIIDDTTTAIKYNPNLSTAYSNRGQAFWNSGQVQLAIADSTKAIALDAKNAEAYSCRGLAYFKQDKNAEAMADCNQAIGLQPKLEAAYRTLGGVYTSMNKSREAVVELSQALMLDPKDAIAYCARGEAYSNLGQYQQSISDCTQAIALDLNLPDAYSTRGVAYLGLKQNDRAIDDCTQAIKMSPTNGVATIAVPLPIEIWGIQVVRLKI